MKKIGYNLKMTTQLLIGFTIIDALLLFLLYSGYTTAATIITVDDPKKYLSNYATFTAVMFISVLVVSGGIIFMMLKLLREGFADVSTVCKALAIGKVDIELKRERKDEFGAMMDELQKAIDSIREEAYLAQEMADGNLCVDVRIKSDEDVMGHSLKKMVNYNRHTLGNIKEAAYQVTTNSTQIASASEALAHGSTEQASAIEQITASIDDVADKTKLNASQANTAANLIAEAIEDVKKGNAEMKQMVEAMSEINASSESISKIIKVIDDIAFQTNILALNAAVEAARAGEVGMGFAVVAEEVRNLAAKSASAAAETEEMIENSIKKVAAGSRIATKTAEAFEDITAAVSKSEVIIKEIAEASNYQATAIAQIDQAMEQVSQVVQMNSATSEECAAASVELSSQANRMRELVSVYKLGSANTGDNGMQSYEQSADKVEETTSLGEGFGKY